MRTGNVHFGFISADEQLEIRIVNYLDQCPRFVTVSELSREFNITQTKIRTILKRLEDRIYKFNHPNLTYTLSKKKGVSFSTPEKGDLKELSAYIIRQSPLVQLFSSIFFETFISVARYSQRHFLSEATVRRYLNKIREILRNYDLTIAKSSFEIAGSENQIRFFLFIFFWRIYRGVVWPFPTVSEQSIHGSVKTLIEKNIIKQLVPIEERRVMYYIAILRIRLRNKHFISTENQRLEQSFHETYFTSYFSLLTKTNFSNKEEAHFSFKFFLGLDWLKPLRQQYFYESKYESVTYKSTQTFFKYFEEDFFIIPSDKKLELELFIFRTHTLARMFTKFDMDENGLFYDDILSIYYPNLKKRLETFIRKLQNSKDALFLEMKFLIIHYAELVLVIDKQTCFEKEILLTFDSTLPKFLQINQINRIQSYFESFFNLIIIPIDSISNPEKIDFVLTSIALTDYSKLFPNAQILILNRMILLNDFQTVENALLKFLAHTPNS